MVSSVPIKYKWFLNRAIWSMDVTQTGTTTAGQSNGIEMTFHAPQLPSWLAL